MAATDAAGAGASTPAAGAATSAATAPGSEYQDQPQTARSRAPGDDAASQASRVTSGVVLAAAATAAAGGADDDSLAPVLLSQGTLCDWSVVIPGEALGLRYGAVQRGRLGRVGMTIPYPGSGGVTATAGAAAGGSVGGGSVVPVAGAATAGGHGQVAAATPSGAAAASNRNRPPPVRGIKFKHVRFNRMHARLTYESPALSIRNFGLVLDNRVYRNIDGGWRTVLNRLVADTQHEHRAAGLFDCECHACVYAMRYTACNALLVQQVSCCWAQDSCLVLSSSPVLVPELPCSTRPVMLASSPPLTPSGSSGMSSARCSSL